MSETRETTQPARVNRRESNEKTEERTERQKHRNSSENVRNWESTQWAGGQEEQRESNERTTEKTDTRRECQTRWNSAAQVRNWGNHTMGKTYRGKVTKLAQQISTHIHTLKH